MKCTKIPEGDVWQQWSGGEGGWTAGPQVRWTTELLLLRSEVWGTSNRQDGGKTVRGSGPIRNGKLSRAVVNL